MFTWAFYAVKTERKKEKRNHLTREHGILFKYPLELGSTLININYSKNITAGELTEKLEQCQAPQRIVPG